MRKTETMTLFHSDADVFSNWHRSPFVYKGHRFNCVEQFMMFSKAKMFGDDKAAAAVMATSDPRQQKALGRAVKGYDDATWSSRRLNIVTVGCREKFLQNPSMLAELLATGTTMIVEASPYDRVWGIGLGQDDPKALDRKQWRGENLLGQALMTVRQVLSAERSAEPAAPAPQRRATP
jgi:ribA/ribD-fused uncharacterized protein